MLYYILTTTYILFSIYILNTDYYVYTDYYQTSTSILHRALTEP